LYISLGVSESTVSGSLLKASGKRSIYRYQHKSTIRLFEIRSFIRVNVKCRKNVVSTTVAVIDTTGSVFKQPQTFKL